MRTAAQRLRDDVYQISPDGRALGMAAGLESVASFSKTKPKEEKVVLFPLKMSPTLISYLIQGVKQNDRRDPMLNRWTD